MLRNTLIIMGMVLPALYGGEVGAQAQFDMTGSIEPGTCTWAVGDDNRTITLDTIDATVLNADGSGNFQTFNLTLQHCAPGLKTAAFQFAGTPDTSDPLRFLNTGSAKGTAIALQSSDGATIGANGTDSSRVVPVVAGEASIGLRAGYWRVGAVSSGSVTSVAMVTVTYQ